MSLVFLSSHPVWSRNSWQIKKSPQHFHFETFFCGHACHTSTDQFFKFISCSPLKQPVSALCWQKTCMCTIFLKCTWLSKRYKCQLSKTNRNNKHKVWGSAMNTGNSKLNRGYINTLWTYNALFLFLSAFQNFF